MTAPAPKVSCLLCTHGRRAMVQLAIDSYLSQDYPEKELVVVDGSTDPIGDLVVGIPGLVYLYHSTEILAVKRNVGCRAATGEFIAHFDDDDWSAPARLSDQVALLQSKRWAEVTGYKSSFWWDRQKRQASRYDGVIWGAGVMYRRSYAMAHPWNERIVLAEDDDFLRPATHAGAVVATHAGDAFVATLHAGNAPRPVGLAPFWPVVPAAALPEGFRKAAGIERMEEGK
jgi:O-antigen biosynthesis protein